MWAVLLVWNVKCEKQVIIVTGSIYTKAAYYVIMQIKVCALLWGGIAYGIPVFDFS